MRITKRPKLPLTSLRVPLTTVTLVSSVLFVHLTVHGKTLPSQATAARNRHFRWENVVLLSVHSATSLECGNVQYSDFAFHNLHGWERNGAFERRGRPRDQCGPGRPFGFPYVSAVVSKVRHYLIKSVTWPPLSDSSHIYNKHALYIR